ncbi:MAG TPA: HIT domain-containing protein [Actinomycetota bacterium]|jgi:diadenosine tetraphosphate (Ap4A) HIT family hydrolase|nr:HIT domain-containing protein [Actinomycetota bacterium]
MAGDQCWACRRENRDREFFDADGWYALLDWRPMVTGHSLLVRVSTDECPRELTNDTLAGFEENLVKVTSALRRHYAATTNVLVASLTGKDPHVHFHLVPVWPVDEAQWREESGLKTGSLFQFLGARERSKPDKELPLSAFGADVDALRGIVGYVPA